MGVTYEQGKRRNGHGQEGRGNRMKLVGETGHEYRSLSEIQGCQSWFWFFFNFILKDIFSFSVSRPCTTYLPSKKNSLVTQ